MDIGLLLWQELFTNSTLFPTETAWDNPHPAKAGISNANILKFLTNAIEPSTLAKTAIKKWQHRDSIKLKRVLEKLTSSDVLGWRDHTMKLLEKIENMEEVSEDLISLSESAFFISYLDVGMFMIQKLKKFI